MGMEGRTTYNTTPIDPPPPVIEKTDTAYKEAYNESLVQSNVSR